jgi:hypothetical protein
VLALVTPAALAASLACLAACGAPQQTRPARSTRSARAAHLAPPTTGAIAGLASDHDSGDPIAKAEIRVRSEVTAAQIVTASGDRGRYGVDRLPPGRYSVFAAFAGQPLDVVNVDVRAGEVTHVDLVFTLGRPERILIDLGARAAQ